MFVRTDAHRILERQRNAISQYWRRECDNCDKGADRAACRKCIKSYLESRQTLEDIRGL